VSTLGDALAAIKRVLLLEERIASQGKKLEQLAAAVVEMERRLAMAEGRMDGFLAAAAAFGSADRSRPTSAEPRLIE
jgi:uncharacterized coiled-coil protein SlyX